jgi:hypothetical protein
MINFWRSLLASAEELVSRVPEKLRHKVGLVLRPKNRCSQVQDPHLTTSRLASSGVQARGR